MQDRLIANFAFLMRDTWSMAFGLTWRLVLWSLLIGFLMALIGGVVGWLTHRWVFRRFLDAPWRWYRWVRWIWPTMFVTLTASGFLAAGLFLGAGYAVKTAINRDRIIDRTVVNVACVLALEDRQHMLDGSEDPDQVARLLDQSNELRTWAVTKTSETLRHDLETHAAEVAHPRLTAMFLWLAGRGWDKANATTGLDLRPIYIALRAPEELDEWKRTHKGASATLAAFTGQMVTVRRWACLYVDQYVYTRAIIFGAVGVTLAIIVAIPVGLMLWPARRLWPGKRPEAVAIVAGASSSAALTSAAAPALLAADALAPQQPVLTATSMESVEPSPVVALPSSVSVEAGTPTDSK